MYAKVYCECNAYVSVTRCLKQKTVRGPRLRHSETLSLSVTQSQAQAQQCVSAVWDWEWEFAVHFLCRSVIRAPFYQPEKIRARINSSFAYEDR